MESDVRLEAGMVIARTRIWTDRPRSKLIGAVRVLAVDDAGNVVGFTGERSVHAGGRVRPGRADRITEWSSALFADTLDEVVALEVVHFLPPRRGLVDRIVDRL